jgi:dihydrofolate synthase / folylpolyglutamate synthase
MTYAQALDLLYTRLPMFSRIGDAAIKKDLDNTIALCEALGNPHWRFKSIHIAGTNGKGSVSHMLAAIFQAAGFRTGLYTSPHLQDFRERIRINGQMCPEDYVTEFVVQHESLVEKVQPSFFEMTVAMAFDFFAREKVDIAIIETGLGGRLDSTNIITPELSVITNIGWDHMSLLGNTLPLIAGEKAGIIKAGVPVVVGETHPETAPVFISRAKAVSAPIRFADQERYVSDWQSTPTGMMVEVAESHDGTRQRWNLDLGGYYQIRNLVTVLGAVHQLRALGWKLTDELVQKALNHVRHMTGLRGRWERVHQHPDIILDVAHNTDGMRQVSEQLELTEHDHLFVVTGMVKDKDVRQVLSILPDDAHYLYTNAHIPRAMPADQLALIGAETGRLGEVFDDVNEAVAHALSRANPRDLILVCGSFFIVGELDTARLAGQH